MLIVLYCMTQCMYTVLFGHFSSVNIPVMLDRLYSKPRPKLSIW